MNLALESGYNACNEMLKNVTSDYIQFIRPLNKKEEDQYKQILYKTKL